MAGIEASLAREYVVAWLENTGDVGTTEKARRQMRAAGLDLTDVMAALESSVCDAAIKEDPNELALTLIGQTCEDEILRMAVIFDPLRGICIDEVEVI